MAKEVPQPALAATASTMWLGKDELLAWHPQKDVAKPYPPAPTSSAGSTP